MKVLNENLNEGKDELTTTNNQSDSNKSLISSNG